MDKDSLNELMNGPIREKLKIIPDCVKWGGTFLSVSVDLMSALLPFTELQSVGKYFTVVSSDVKLSLSLCLRRGLILRNEHVMGQPYESRCGSGSDSAASVHFYSSS